MVSFQPCIAFELVDVDQSHLLARDSLYLRMGQLAILLLDPKTNKQRHEF
jgi:hypothetical protein